MRRLLRSAALIGAAFYLAACSVTTSGVTTATTSTVEAFQNICLTLPNAHNDFLAVAAAFKVKQSVLDAEIKAYNAGMIVCTSGVVQDTAAAVKSVAGAVQQVKNATKQAGG